MQNTKEIDQFREYLSRRVSPGTTALYLTALRSWFGTVDGGSATPKAAQEYIDSLSKHGLSPNTVGIRAHAIMRFFRWRGNEIHLDCPTIRVGEPKYVNMAQLNIIIRACGSQLERTLIIVLFDTAVRISELLNLEVDDIDYENGFITVTRKGGIREAVNISTKALDELSAWIKLRKSESKRAFMDIQYSDAHFMIKRIGKRAGVELTPHMLRHSRAVFMLLHGATLHDVMQHLGHSSINTTAAIYGKFKAVDTKKRIPSW
jgi:integrase/recombinase XerD